MADKHGITSPLNSTAELRPIAEVATSLFENRQLGVLIFDDNAEIIYSDPAFNQWIGKGNLRRKEAKKSLTHNLRQLITLFNDRRRSIHEIEHANLEISREGMTLPIVIHGIIFNQQPSINPTQYCLIGWLEEDLPLPIENSQQQAMANLITSVPIGIISINHHWECEFVNKEFCLLTERTEQQLLGRGWTQVFENSNERLQELVQSLLNESVARCEINLTIPGKPTCILELDIRAYINREGKLSHAVGALVDVSERVERQNHIHRLANYDPITGLHNRLSMQHQLERYIEVAQKLYQKVQLMLIDLDGFKSVNDLYGHPVGDQLLRQVADRVSANIRTSDVVARVGGDEFVILIPGDIREEIVDSIAHKINSAIAQKYKINTLQIHVTSSIGISSFEAHEESPLLKPQEVVDSLMKEADIALYAAKQQGKNVFKRYNQQHSDQVTSIFRISQRLPTAISRNLFYINYQPIIDCESKKPIALEALLRWNDKELGNVTPDVFITFAESHGKILDVQQCMIEKVGKDLIDINRELLKTGLEPKIAINLSGLQLLDSESLFGFLETLTKLDIDPRQTTLEITESILLEDHENILPHLCKLKASGYELALDDFGTGFSSLSYLTKFPIDYVKLDKFFVQSIEEDAQQMSLVSGVIQLSHSLGKQVVAEGVESEQQLKLLQQQRCNYAQGYLISKPLIKNDIVLWLLNYTKNT